MIIEVNTCVSRQGYNIHHEWRQIVEENALDIRFHCIYCLQTVTESELHDD